ncbi:MAG: ribokinase [Chloroflexi bacterium]|nr:ribokinase [Chloroflexota bacterium]
MTTRITVIGSLNMDLVARSPRIPTPGETIIGREFRTAPGGKGANQAVAAARLGGRVSMVGCVGQDAFGDALLENLSANRVDHRFVRRADAAATGVAIIVVDDSGENSIVVLSGANNQLSPQDVETAESLIAQSEVLLLQLESPLESVIRAAQLGRKHGVTVILNPAPARALPVELFKLVDILIPNETETAMLTGMTPTTESEWEEAARALRDLGVGAVIVTLGKRGALISRPGDVRRAPAFEVTPVDTTAAGDAFVGGFAVALAEGETFAEAVRWGSAAGALATTRFGAQPSLPTRSELEKLL